MFYTVCMEYMKPKKKKQKVQKISLQDYMISEYVRKQGL